MDNLSKQQMINVIEGKECAKRIPIVYKFWIEPEVFGDNKDAAIKVLEKYPSDADTITLRMPEVFDAPDDDRTFKWYNRDKVINDNTAIDETIAINDWDELHDVLADFPNPESYHIYGDYQINPDKYTIGNWWYSLFERHWSLRGMSNALTDFYLYPNEVHRLYQALTDFYMRVMEIAKEKYNLDAFFTSDDLGTQESTFFSPEIFREFFKPYYKQIVDKAHSLNTHFWLHTCGNIEKFIPEYIDISLDVLHPIQKYTMDQKKIAEKYGKDICIWAGFDVQQIIPWGTTDEVRNEVKRMIDCFYNDRGRFILTFGNMITSDCKLSSLEAVLDESYKYGLMKCK